MESTQATDETRFDALDGQLRGDLLRPGGDGYDDARTLWNGMFDRHPAAIAACAGVADVIAAVDFAREHDLRLSVKSGGHDYAGKSVCDDGLVIDLSGLDAVRVNPAAGTAWVQPGVTWGAFRHETHPFGLATTGGADVVGVPGFTLGGGVSHMTRAHGLGCDNLLAADVVTADGELVRASSDENPDLFWGLRGGGGNFGVVTALKFDLHEVGPEVLAGQLVYPVEDAAEVLRFYRDFMAEAPDELGCFATVFRIPRESPFPETVQGEPALAISVCYVGPVADGREVVEPLRAVGDPILDAVRPIPYVEFKRGNEELEGGVDRWYSRSHYLEALPDGAIDVIVDHTRNLPGPLTVVGILAMGGAFGRVPASQTAFPHRDAAFEFDVWPAWRDPDRDDELVGWARSFHEAMAPYSTGGVYVNMLSRDEGDRVRAAYGENYDRLVAVKRAWDPDNLFRMNQNIDPDLDQAA